MVYEKIKKDLSYLGEELVLEILENSMFKEIPKDTRILSEGQYVKVIPIVSEGLIKVFTSQEDKDLLLYYIQPGDTCIMSFAASLKNEPSKVYAETEEDTSALLLPVEKVAQWIKQYPDFNTLFYHQFNVRYADLLETINHLLFAKLDQRLYAYLLNRKEITGKNTLKITHRQIANELGTAREVITRVMKKLEQENKVKQLQDHIEIL